MQGRAGQCFLSSLTSVNSASTTSLSPARWLDEAPALDAKEQSLLAQARNYRDLLDSIPGIRSVRVNLLARSCTVEYDRAVIPFQAWPDFLAGVRSDEAGVLITIIEEKYTEVAGA